MKILLELQFYAFFTLLYFHCIEVQGLSGAALFDFSQIPSQLGPGAGEERHKM